jgi:hypothetical protein
MTDPARLNSIPKKMLSVYEKIVGLTDDVCDKHLNSEYRDLARAMTKVLCRKGAELAGTLRRASLSEICWAPAA